MYKSLPYPFQLVCTNATRVENIGLQFERGQPIFNFTHLNEVDNLPLNSLIGKSSLIIFFRMRENDF